MGSERTIGELAGMIPAFADTAKEFGCVLKEFGCMPDMPGIVRARGESSRLESPKTIRGLSESSRRKSGIGDKAPGKAPGKGAMVSEAVVGGIVRLLGPEARLRSCVSPYCKMM